MNQKDTLEDIKDLFLCMSILSFYMYILPFYMYIYT